jgi:hypothetical protein
MRLAVASEIILLTKQQERLTPPEAMGDAARNVLSGLAQDVFYYVAQAPGIFLPPFNVDAVVFNKFIDLSIAERRTRILSTLQSSFPDELKSLKSQYRGSWYNLKSEKFALLFPDPLVESTDNLAALQLVVANAESPMTAFRATSVLERTTSARLRELNAGATRLLALRTRILAQAIAPPAAVEEILRGSLLSSAQARVLEDQFKALGESQAERNLFVNGLILSRLRVLGAQRIELLAALPIAVMHAEEQRVSKPQSALLRAHLALVNFDGGAFAREIRNTLQTLQDSPDPADVEIAFRGVILEAKQTSQALTELIRVAQATGARARGANTTVVDAIADALARSKGTTDQGLIDLIERATRSVDSSMAAQDVLQAELAALFEQTYSGFVEVLKATVTAVGR